MNIIIIGCGKVGARFAQVLSQEGHDVVIVDSDRNSFKMLKPNFSGITVTGVPIDQDVLKQAGIETADALAAVTPDDNVNIMACQVAKEIFRVPRVIARIYNPEREHVFHQFGLDTICPTNLTVDVIRSKILDEAGMSRHSICGESFAFRTKSVGKEEEGRRISAVRLKGASFLFGIRRQGAFLFPNPGIKLIKGDVLVIADLIR
jgi:trk system potassium uptake protein TrkA